MNQFKLSFTNAEEPTQNQKYVCNESELGRYVGTSMADAIIMETQACVLELSVTIVNDLTRWQVTFIK